MQKSKFHKLGFFSVTHRCGIPIFGQIHQKSREEIDFSLKIKIDNFFDFRQNFGANGLLSEKILKICKFLLIL